MSKVYWLDMEIAIIHVNDEEEAICNLCHKRFKRDKKVVDGEERDWYSLKLHFITDHLTTKKEKEKV
jgi:hypothetical protein